MNFSSGILIYLACLCFLFNASQSMPVRVKRGNFGPFSHFGGPIINGLHSTGPNEGSLGFGVSEAQEPVAQAEEPMPEDEEPTPEKEALEEPSSDEESQDEQVGDKTEEQNSGTGNTSQNEPEEPVDGSSPLPEKSKEGNHHKGMNRINVVQHVSNSNAGVFITTN